MLSEENLSDIRDILEQKAEEYLFKEKCQGHVRLDIPVSLLNELILERVGEGSKYFAVSNDCINALDLTGLSFDDARVSEKDYSKTSGIEINPQTIYDRDLSKTRLCNVRITGTLENVKIKKTDFTGIIGDLYLNPQTIYDKDLSGSTLCGVTIKGVFDDCNVEEVNFKGAKGNIYLDPQKVKNKSLHNTKLHGVDLIGSLEGCNLENADFTGSRGAVLRVRDNEELSSISEHTNLTDVKIINEYEETLNIIIESFANAISREKEISNQKVKSQNNKN